MNFHSLRPALVSNAVFSGASGLVLVLASPLVARWLGPQVHWVYPILGAGLLLFCLTLCAVAVRPAPLAVLGITAADFGWVAATTVVLFVWRHDFTPLGFPLVLSTNAVVSTLAWFQKRSIEKAFRVFGGSPDEYQVCIAVDTPVNAGAFWNVLSDLGSIQRHMPGLRFSALTTGERPGVGCVRTCENLKGQRWSERCDEWVEGSSFTVVFQADAAGFPYPFSKMRGGWRVVPIATGCRVEVWWRVVPRRPWTAPVILPFMAASAQRAFAGVIARMASAAQGRSAGTAMPPTPRRLRAALC